MEFVQAKAYESNPSIVVVGVCVCIREATRFTYFPNPRVPYGEPADARPLFFVLWANFLLSCLNVDGESMRWSYEKEVIKRSERYMVKNNK